VVAGGTIGTADVGGEYLPAGGKTIIGSSQVPPAGTAIAHGHSGGHSGCGFPGCTVGFGHTHPGYGSGGGIGCGIPGCGVSHTHGDPSGGHGAGTGCNFCGGQGCQKCLAAAHGAIAGLHGHLASLAGLLHHPKLTYFVGAGGPVPLTPGYVPYIVATRSPRDYFAFPPRNPNDP